MHDIVLYVADRLTVPLYIIKDVTVPIALPEETHTHTELKRYANTIVAYHKTSAVHPYTVFSRVNAHPRFLARKCQAPVGA